MKINHSTFDDNYEEPSAASTYQIDGQISFDDAGYGEVRDFMAPWREVDIDAVPQEITNLEHFDDVPCGDPIGETGPRGDMTTQEQDNWNKNVNHPAHYNQGKYECIDVMREVFGDEAVKTWIKLNIFKYSWRADAKNHDEDIEKITWYSNYYQRMCNHEV